MFEREETTYQQKLPELLASEGSFAIIFDDQVTVFDTLRDGLTFAYSKYGLTTPFLVRQIFAVEPVVRL